MKRLALVLAPALAGALCGPAAAAVRISPTAVTVTAPGGASAVVTRSPFGLSFADARGHVVLREVAAPRLGLQPLPGVPQQQFGEQGPPQPTLYAPLSFVVGTQRIAQTPTSQWEGTLQSVTTAGVAYGATGVVSATAAGGAARLVLATSDPSGRRLAVTIRPQGRALRIEARPTPDAGVAAMADSFTAPPGEAYHGFGGRHNALDQRGTDFYDWLQQENLSSGSTGGPSTPSIGDTYMFPNGPHAAYYVQSAFASSRRYGFLLDRDELSHFRMAADRPDAWQAEAGGPGLDYVVAPAASEAAAVRALNGLIGRQPAPPAWALGTIFDREVRFPSDPAAQYEQEVESDIKSFDRYHVHVDGYRIEGWQMLSKPVLGRIIRQLRARGIHPMLYFRAFVGTDTQGTDDPKEYAEALAKGYVATHADGSPYVFVANFNAPSAVIDFTNPAAAAWWRGRITQALRLGADGFMQDFGEQVLTDMHFHNGLTGVQMHNRLVVLYQRETSRAIAAFRRTHPKRRIFFFTRAGYSGTPGSAAYENANFPGDETTDWTRASGLASLAPDMLNRSIGGAFGFTTDIGGYFDIGPYPQTGKELFLRWAEWAALSPFFRLHGSILHGVHTPWSFDTQTVAIYERLAALHARLRPLLLRLWHNADRTGTPVVRPLWLAAPGDPRAAGQDQEWMLGPDLLAAPVVTEGATSRSVYLPAGCWRLRGGGARLRGRRSVTAPAPLASAVYFTRCGRRPLAPAASA